LLLAKPIFDIDIIIPSASPFSSIAAALAQINYTYNSDQGIQERHAFKHHGTDGLMKRSVYVFLEGCLALRNHLAVRDISRTNEGLTNEYEAVMVELAKEGITVDECCAAKGEGGFEEDPGEGWFLVRRRWRKSHGVINCDGDRD
jgi:GrpB-like predicted nucleotidyltransferase (UPF0157 family)